MSGYLIFPLLLLFYYNYSHFYFLFNLWQYENILYAWIYTTYGIFVLIFTQHYFMNSFLHFCIVFIDFLQFSLEQLSLGWKSIVLNNVKLPFAGQKWSNRILNQHNKISLITLQCLNILFTGFNLRINLF